MADFTGTEDDDVLNGSAGNVNDTLNGLGGDDSLNGRAGDDILIGGPGDDTLNGAGGSDTFVFNFAVNDGATHSALDFTDWAAANGFGTINDGVTQNIFSTAYTAWLAYVIDELGIGEDLDGDGVEFGLNQNDPNGTPWIEGMSQEDLDAIFGDRTDLTVKTGKVSQERYYSDSASIGGGLSIDGEGYDTIIDLQNAAPNTDKIVLNGLAGLDDTALDALFELTVGDVDGDDVLDSVLSWQGGSITLLGTSTWGNDVLAFMHDDQVELA